jgi:hypothetical protein
MKRIVVALALACLVTGAAYAVPDTGTWMAPSDFDTGIWQELFLGGGPGQAGNVISAVGTEWSLTGATLTPPVLPIANPPYNYQTTYVGGVLTLNDGGPWNGGGTYIANLGPVIVNSSGTLPDNQILWTLEGSGVIVGSGLPVFLTATFAGPFTPIPGSTGATVGMLGQVTSAEISIIPVPGAILLGTIGAGFVGWLRRRRSL